MLLLHNHCHQYFLPLDACTVVGLPNPCGKCLQREFGWLQADWRLPFCTAHVRWNVALISCTIIVICNLCQWRHGRIPWGMSFLQVCWRLQLFLGEANWRSSRCAGRRFMWKIRAGGCWPIEWMVFRQSWRHSWCTWWWRPFSWNLRKGEHFRPVIFPLVEVISLPLWPMTRISLACAGGWLRTGCHVEWRMLITLRRPWKWLLWRQVTIPIRRMISIGMFPKSTVFISGSSWTISRWSWIGFTALFHII